MLVDVFVLLVFCQMISTTHLWVATIQHHPMQSLIMLSQPPWLRRLQTLRQVARMTVGMRVQLIAPPQLMNFFGKNIACLMCSGT